MTERSPVSRSRFARAAVVALEEFSTPARRGGLFLAGLAFAASLGVLFGDSVSDEFRLAGVVLQVLGLVFVALALLELRTLFRQPSIVERAFGALERIRAAAAPPVEGKGTIVLMGAGVVGIGTVTADLTVGPALTVERQMQRLEEDVAALKNRLSDATAEMRRSVADAERRSVEKTARLESLVNQSASTAEAALLGDISHDWIGLWWLVLATVASSASDELAILVTTASSWWTP